MSLGRYRSSLWNGTTRAKGAAERGRVIGSKLWPCICCPDARFKLPSLAGSRYEWRDEDAVMGRRILIGCWEVPGWGGAATCAYLLFEQLQRDGWEVAYVNLIRAADETWLRSLFGDALGNPRALERVYNCRVEDPYVQGQPDLAAVARRVAPDVL